jgi:uncharacterized protein
VTKALIKGVAIFLAGVLAWSAPAHAQFSDGYRFLEAVKKRDGDAVTNSLTGGGATLVNTRDITTGDSALHIVVARRDRLWLEFLISKGANVNIRNTQGVTPLVAACNINFIEGVEVLVAHSARVDDPNNTGETPLIAAVHAKNLELMRMLLRAGANPDRADNSGRSARDYAVLDGRNSSTLGVIERDARAQNAQQGTRPVYGPSR